MAECVGDLLCFALACPLFVPATVFFWRAIWLRSPKVSFEVQEVQQACTSCAKSVSSVSLYPISA